MLEKPDALTVSGLMTKKGVSKVGWLVVVMQDPLVEIVEVIVYDRKARQVCGSTALSIS